MINAVLLYRARQVIHASDRDKGSSMLWKTTSFLHREFKTHLFWSAAYKGVVQGGASCAGVGGTFIGEGAGVVEWFITGHL